MSTHEKGVYVGPDGKKKFVPLENNPEVFTELVHRLGLSDQLAFHDVYSVEDADLLALVPRPAIALIFISPGDVYYRVHSHTEFKVSAYGSNGEEPIVWFKQTIGNTCGFIALLHSIANGPAKAYIQPDSLIDRLVSEGLPLDPDGRAKVLYDSAELERVYMTAALKGDSAAPPAEERPGYHFLAFVKGTNNHLYEVEGSFNGPVDLGDIGEEEDLLSKRAIELGIGRYLKVADGNMEFSIIALSGKQDG